MSARGAALIVRSLREFPRSPRGSYVCGEGWLYYVLADGLSGYALWGTPSADAMGQLIGVLEGELSREPHVGIVDLVGLEGAHPAMFNALRMYTTKNAERLAEIVTHTAMVRPPGLMGAVAEGFFRVVPAPFPVTFYADVASAVAKLAPRHAAETIAAIEDARRAAVGTPAVVLALAAYLKGELRDPGLELAARALSVSVRTLQRRLTQAGTSFAREVTRARIASAKLRLAATNDPITTIALELGCASPSHFADMFRKETGMTPTAFRAGESEPPSPIRS